MEEGEGKVEEDVKDHAIILVWKPVEKKKKDRAETLVIRWRRERGRRMRMWKTTPSTPPGNLSKKTEQKHW